LGSGGSWATLPCRIRSAEAFRIQLELLALAPVLDALLCRPLVETGRQLGKSVGSCEAGVDLDAEQSPGRIAVTPRRCLRLFDRSSVCRCRHLATERT